MRVKLIDGREVDDTSEEWPHGLRRRASNGCEWRIQASRTRPAMDERGGPLMRQNDYTPVRRFVNVEGQDTIPIRLPEDRMAWLVLPRDFRPDDIERIIAHMKLIAEVDAVRNPGPPEPNGRNP